MLTHPAKIAVFVSGGGTNLQALIDAARANALPHGQIVLVLSSNPTAYALERAKSAHIPTAVVSRKSMPDQAAFEREIIKKLDEYSIDVIVLAGFMSILSADFTARYPDRILNVHPSLIPSFCGKGYYGLRVHEAALARGVKVTGATVHLVNEIPDGGRILLQKPVAVRADDTPETLQRRVMEEAEWKLLPQATELICAEHCASSTETNEKEDAKMSIYATPPIASRVSGNPYVGRGIVIGKTADATRALFAYFIMGRSENSRNRVFVSEGDTLFTRPFDASKVEDPSLIIYAAVRTLGNHIIVTNGDQTDTIYDGLKAGKDFSTALTTRTFEPDAPNWTPRISGLLTFSDTDFSYQMSILKSADEAGTACARFTFSYPSIAGVGHFIHTYQGDGTPLPTFCGEPERVEIPNDPDAFADALWAALHPENKIALYVRTVDLRTGASEDRLINKHC